MSGHPRPGRLRSRSPGDARARAGRPRRAGAEDGVGARRSHRRLSPRPPRRSAGSRRGGRRARRALRGFRARARAGERGRGGGDDRVGEGARHGARLPRTAPRRSARAGSGDRGRVAPRARPRAAGRRGRDQSADREAPRGRRRRRPGGDEGVSMDFRFTPEQEAFRESVRRFAEKNLAKAARERAHASDYPFEVAKLMAGQGLLGISIAEADGGQGGALIDAVIAIETVASACPRSADVVQAGNFGPIRVLAEYGSKLQKDRYLKRLLAGESVISVGMTEPEAGSAVTDLQTTAKPEGGGYRINGSKIFTTHSKYAELMLVYVRFGPGVDGIGSVLIDTKGQGVRFGKPSTFMSGEEWVQTYFENAFVSAEMVVLKEGGFKKQIAGFNVERVGNAARSLALGRYAYETARRWAM